MHHRSEGAPAGPGRDHVADPSEGMEGHASESRRWWLGEGPRESSRRAIFAFSPYKSALMGSNGTVVM